MPIQAEDRIVISVMAALGIITFALSFGLDFWPPFFAWVFVLAALMLTALIMVLWGAIKK